MTSRLPPGMLVQFDDPSPPIPQAVQRSVANFDAFKLDSCLYGSSLVAENSSATMYSVKNGLIRILLKPENDPRLIRHHSGDTVTDVVFFNATDILATVSHTKLVIQRELEVLLEVQSRVNLRRIVWHPSNLNLFWILDSSDQAVLLDSRSLRTEQHEVHGYNVAQVPENSTIIPDVLDLCWHSSELVVTINASAGFLLVWKSTPHLTLLHKVPVIGASVQRCVSLGDNYLITLQEDGTLTIWDTSGQELRVHQTVRLSSNGGPLLLSCTTVESETPSKSLYLTLCSREVGNIYVLEVSNGAISNINVVEAAQPSYAISATRAVPTTHSDDPNGIDIEFVAYHPKAVQKVTVPWTLLQQRQQGIRVLPLQTATPAASETAFAEYEVEEEDVVDQDDLATVSAAPRAPSVHNNVFANWLGSLAAQNPTQTPAPPVATPQQPTFTPSLPQNMLASASAPVFLSPNQIASSRNPTPPHLPTPPPNHTPTPPPHHTPTPPPHHTPTPPPHIPTPPPPSQTKKKASPTREVLTPDHGTAGSFVDGDSLANTVRQVVQEELRSIVLPKLPNNKKQNKAHGVPTKEDVERMVEAAQADTVKKVLIPAVESITAQVLQKVSIHLEQQQKRSDGNKSQLESMSKQLSKMTALVSELTKEVHGLRNVKSNGASPQQEKQQSPTVDTTEASKHTIRNLLGQKKYDEAFSAALHSGARMTVFCCRNADISILGGETPGLSQGIMLCVMQQLGTTLIDPSSTLEVELNWLQELVVTLDTTDMMFQNHGQNVVQELLGYLVQRQQRHEPPLRRPLQRMVQLLRGLQAG